MMKKFSIEVISKKPKQIWGLPAYEGRITIGDFHETLFMPINSWSIEEYQQQWKEGLERIKNNDTSCLVVTVQNLSTHPLIELWTLYKVEDKVFIHNQMLNAEIVKELNLTINLSNFNKTSCYQFINPRITNELGEVIDEDGETISEWSIPLSEI
jgi:hypothetical protein